MPIKLQIHHPDRMVLGVAQGAITVRDLDRFLAEIAEAGAFRYRKIVDLMGATLAFSPEELTAFSERVRGMLADKQTGPIAIVTAEAQSALSRLFAELTIASRPAAIFRSIHDARRWLHENSRIG